MSKQTPSSASRRPGAPSTRGGSTAASRRPAVRRRVQGAERSTVTFGLPLDKKNWIGVVAGVVVIVIGYLLMATAITNDPAHNDGIWNNFSSVTLAPILLGLGYCVIVPFSLLYRFNKEEETVGDGGVVGDNA
jgi:hypothetical protein